LLPVTTDTVLVNGPFDVAKLAETLGLAVKDLHDLNPELRKPLLPSVAAGYALKIPADKRLAFDALSRADLYAACRPTAAATVALAEDSATAANRPVYKAARYVVRRGETLQRVALKNGCTVAQLRAWNKLRSKSAVRAGQGLVVWRAVKPTTPVTNPAPVAAAESTAVAATTATPSTESKAPAVVTGQADSDPVVAAAAPAKPTAPLAAVAGLSATELERARATGYTVQQGDNLFQVARVFGVSVKKLTEWNGLGSAQVQVGQTLVVRGAAADLPTNDAAATAAVTAPEETALADATVQPGGELAGDEYVAAPKTKSNARALAAARNRWAAARARVRAVHLVQPGDTLWDISRKRNVSVEQIRKLNRLKSDALRPGQRIVLS
jgi:membrane-bound lytic murein transglycosylase D